MSVGSRLGMAKDIRRFGAKGPAMGMLRLARDAGLYRGSMTTLCAAGKVIEKFAPMCAAKNAWRVRD